MVYTFGGQGENQHGELKFLNSIERVNFTKHLQGGSEDEGWETLNLTWGKSLPARQFPLFVSISESELLILGGDCNQQRCGDVYLINIAE